MDEGRLNLSGEKKVTETLRSAGYEPADSRFSRGIETAEASAREIGVPDFQYLVHDLATWRLCD